jgi:hypothetical protein
MKKVLLSIALAAASVLGGCIVVEEDHVVRHPQGIYGPPCGVVEVVPVPPPHWHGPPRHHRHR